MLGGELDMMTVPLVPGRGSLVIWIEIAQELTFWRARLNQCLNRAYGDEGSNSAMVYRQTRFDQSGNGNLPLRRVDCLRE